MGFRFRKSIRIAPGIRLNISKSGTSLSVGGKGLTTNISKRGTKTTVGLPGTGMSYSSFSPRKKRNASHEQIVYRPPPPRGRALRNVLIAIFSLLVLMLAVAIMGSLSIFS
jgi:hypothetical protein